MKTLSNYLKLVVAVLALTSLNARAEVRVEGAWMRLLPPMSKMTAVYMTLKSDQDDRLVSASSDSAGLVEIHQSKMQDGVMSMQEVSCLELPENQAVELKPQSYHLMVMGLKAPLKAGDVHRFVLEFEQSGILEINVPVKER